MSVFDNKNSLSIDYLLSIGFKKRKTDRSKKSVYYSWEGLVDYFPQDYEGHDLVYGEKPKDIVVGFSETEVYTVKFPDNFVIDMIINQAKHLL